MLIRALLPPQNEAHSRQNEKKQTPLAGRPAVQPIQGELCRRLLAFSVRSGFLPWFWQHLDPLPAGGCLWRVYWLHLQGLPAVSTRWVIFFQVHFASTHMCVHTQTYHTHTLTFFPRSIEIFIFTLVERSRCFECLFHGQSTLIHVKLPIHCPYIFFNHY